MLTKRAMTDNSALEELFTAAKDTAREIAEQEELRPALLVSTANRQISVVSFDGLNEDIKEHFQQILAYVLRQLDAQAYVFCVEAFSSKARRVVSGELRPSEAPPDDRDEIVILIGAEKGGQAKGVSAIIDYKPEGRRLREWKALETVEGRLVLERW